MINYIAVGNSNNECNNCRYDQRTNIHTKVDMIVMMLIIMIKRGDESKEDDNSGNGYQICNTDGDVNDDDNDDRNDDEYIINDYHNDEGNDN